MGSDRDVKAFGQRVRFLRKLEGITQAQLAERAGLSLEHLNKLERGAAAPSFKAICALARALVTEPANLLLFFSGDEQRDETGACAADVDWRKHVSIVGAWAENAQGLSCWTESLARLLGVSAKRIGANGFRIDEFFLPEDRERFRRIQEDIGQGISVAPEILRVRRADGETRLVVIVAEMVAGQGSEPVKTMGCLVDVTEPLHLERALRTTRDVLEHRVCERTEALDKTISKLNTEIVERERAHRSLRETEGRTRVILDALPLLVAQLDTSGRYLFVNKHYATYFGGTPEGIIGAESREIMGTEMFAKAEPFWRKCLDGERAIFEFAHEFPNGSRPVIYGQFIPARDERGRVTSVYTWGMDISERKFAEQALLRAKEEAEAASRAKSEFVASISHEIRNPLGGLLAMLQLAALESGEEERAEYLRSAMSASSDILQVLDDVLDLSRIEAHRLNVRSERFVPSETARAALALVVPEAQVKGLAVRERLSPALDAEFMGDAARLKQIFVNLLGNAVKYTERGEISFEGWVEESPQEGLRLAFSVTDTGPGMSPEVRQIVFEPFERGEQPRRRVLRGTGLGLSIVKRLLDLMSGSIEIESELGRGTTVRVSLPTAAAPARVARERPRASSAPMYAVAAEVPAVFAARGERNVLPLRILFVEDDALARVGLCRLLERRGHVVRPASNGKEALKALCAESFDVVLMDIELPDLDGVEIARRVRGGLTDGSDPSVPIIALSAHALHADREASLGAGMDAHLVKPVQVDQLLAAVDEVLAARGSGLKASVIKAGDPVDPD
ncbi:transcriptional regulator, XRE family [Alkalidesulfovibrio alkalitolerans DSM 16529]|uniref:histidine kinase n=1 Tax=Alkalidesulfovibrio alkalitolerans DSM 16529 TaxID=1121439 RepID=S7TG14_9BACT|nr:ATP-binding protein [Alkalidesulfovibrio alkalitolerans]EPR35676.1 transcriptional regulator, XRE family [Alkalidesulfovibrio alkalitolerans DSM 16529]